MSSRCHDSSQASGPSSASKRVLRDCWSSVRDMEDGGGRIEYAGGRKGLCGCCEDIVCLSEVLYPGYRTGCDGAAAVVLDWD